MRVECLSHIQNRNYTQSALQTKTVDAETSVPTVQTSIYSQKGVTLPFGGWSKSANKVEQDCLDFLHKFCEENKCRQYYKYEIKSMFDGLFHGQKDREPLEMLKTIFGMHQDTVPAIGEEARPKVSFVRDILKLTKDRGEREYFGILEFAQHELDVGAVAPVSSLAKAKPEHQEMFVKLITDIEDLTDPFEFRFGKGGVDRDTISDLYSDLRHVIYTAEDLPTLTNEQKLERLSDVKSDYDFIKKNADAKLSDKAKDAALDVSRRIIVAMTDVLGL